MVLVAAGLLASASLRVREAARITQCQNNFRQLGMGLHHYQDTYTHFPLATIPNEELSPGKRLSWLVETLPFMDQLGLDLDRTKAWDAEGNREPKGRGIEEPPFILGDLQVLLCPGNPARGEPGLPGVTHYVGVAGLGKEAASKGLGYTEAGFFGYNRGLTLHDLPGGQAQALMAIETTWSNGPWTAGGRPTVRGLDTAGPAYIGRGGQFGGSHRGGAVAVFADGSVRFIKDSIERRTLEGLVTLRGEHFEDD
jgi:prepilin-type processing-associated H-X9-DG protein